VEEQLYITIDEDEQINLRDHGYITDDEFNNKEALTDAIHSVISDLWKMKYK